MRYRSNRKNYKNVDILGGVKQGALRHSLIFEDKGDRDGNKLLLVPAVAKLRAGCRPWLPLSGGLWNQDVFFFPR